MQRLVLLVCFSLFAFVAPTASGQTPKVRAVLFYSPTCPHCHQVIAEDLPVIFENFGGQPALRFDESLAQEDLYLYALGNDQLELLLVDASIQAGALLYQSATEHFQIPDDRQGVPRLIVDDVILVGSIEIPEQFPVLIEQGLARGGVDWPAIPELPAAIAFFETGESTASDPISEASPPSVLPGESLSALEKLQLDPVGNSIAVVVLIGMLFSLAGVVLRWQSHAKAFAAPPGLIPLLALLGLGVAGYLTYIESSGELAVCGPVGDCNAVQQSEYAHLFGIPVGAIGVLGYLGLLAAWGVWRFGEGSLSRSAALAQFAMAVIGVLFSVYLTFLEPFVIGATCAWCLASALLMSGLMWLSVDPAVTAWRDGKLPQAASA